jgi:uncharacterized membrane protein
MIRSELVTIVNRPIEVVFDYLADFSQLPAYEPAVESVQRTSNGPIAVGSTWTHARRMGRRRVVAPIVLIEYQRPDVLAITSDSGPVKVRARQVFETVADGTRVTEVLEMKVSGPARLFEPLIRRQAEHAGRAAHAGFKAILEERAS